MEVLVSCQVCSEILVLHIPLNEMTAALNTFACENIFFNILSKCPSVFLNQSMYMHQLFLQFLMPHVHVICI